MVQTYYYFAHSFIGYSSYIYTIKIYNTTQKKRKEKKKKPKRGRCNGTNVPCEAPPQSKTGFASFQTFSRSFHLVKSVKIQENKPELKTGNGVQAQRDRIKLNAFVFTFSTGLKIWSFQVVDVQDGREMQSGCFAY